MRCDNTPGIQDLGREWWAKRYDNTGDGGQGIDRNESQKTGESRAKATRMLT